MSSARRREFLACRRRMLAARSSASFDILSGRTALRTSCFRPGQPVRLRLASTGPIATSLPNYRYGRDNLSKYIRFLGVGTRGTSSTRRPLSHRSLETGRRPRRRAPSGQNADRALIKGVLGLELASDNSRLADAARSLPGFSPHSARRTRLLIYIGDAADGATGGRCA